MNFYQRRRRRRLSSAPLAAEVAVSVFLRTANENLLFCFFYFQFQLTQSRFPVTHLLAKLSFLQSDTFERQDTFFISIEYCFCFEQQTLTDHFSLFQNWLDSGSIRIWSLWSTLSSLYHHHHQLTIWLPIMD